MTTIDPTPAFQAPDGLDPETEAARITDAILPRGISWEDAYWSVLGKVTELVTARNALTDLLERAETLSDNLEIENRALSVLHSKAVDARDEALARIAPDQPAPVAPPAALDVEGIRSRADKATEGKWSHCCEHCAEVFGPDGEVVIHTGITFEDADTIPSREQQIKDAEFIAHARTDILALLSEVARLTANAAQPQEMSDD